jgi:Asp-tRNA(Asn)/Glu-tRNA(Gln) amidotransferase A subunit family amidase
MPGLDCLVPGGDVRVAGADGGPLAGRTFVAKDVIDVAGHPTGAGNPALRATAAPAAESADAVAALLGAGAELVGKARTDELAYSLLGRNLLDGSPANPRHPGHVTGGSSSGSAAAVAGGLADIGIGTDTGGSIRVPAAYCGLVGLRPTHGRVSTAGMVPLAPRFDTIGWLTTDVALAATVAGVLCSDWTPGPPWPSGLIVADDLVALAEAPIADAVAAAAASLGRRTHLDVDHIELGRADDLERWREGFRVLQGRAAWRTHGAWIEAEAPPLSAPVAARFDAARRITDAEVAAAEGVALELRTRLAALVTPGTILLLPAVPAGPPRADIDDEAADAVRAAVLRLTCLAPLTGSPSLAMPDGVALLGAPGDDEALLATAALLGPG